MNRFFIGWLCWGLLSLSLFSGCAPFTWSAHSPKTMLSSSDRLALSRLNSEPTEFSPTEGLIFALEASETTTIGFASDPLENLWWGETEKTIEPVLAMEDDVRFDLPQSDHRSVEQWVEFLQGRGRKWFRIWLARSTRYVPLFYSVLDEYDLPRDLVFLAMVESGFSPRAFSWASASGPWQFMPETGRRYGLRVGFWVDERRDFEKASVAAARHLRWLYSVFDDWHLAMAAYNAGAGRIRSALRRTRVRDFWSLQRTRQIKRETKHYVPKILASAIIAKEPVKYSFDDVPYQPVMSYDTVTVTVATSLSTIGEACGGLPSDALEELNPALRVAVTPPGERWVVRVPKGFGELCSDGLKALPKESRITFRYHEAVYGQSVQDIAKKYNTEAEAILRFHGASDGQAMENYAEIAVPVLLDRASKLPIVRPGPKQRGGRYEPGSARPVWYRARSGDSLWKVARRFKVSIRKLRSWNRLWRSNALRIGQTLKVYPDRRYKRTSRRRKQSSARRAVGSHHRVREGESLWLIARRYRTTVTRLQKLNGLKPGKVLTVGQVLKLR